MKKMFVLIDCNNFYVSCERVFDPKLNNIPVAILSNNDGCIVARSNEVKKLNIPMGAPYFKYKGLLEYNNGKVFSSNYQLYGDMSQRVMDSIKMLLSGEIEVYSIDEAFIYLDSNNTENLFELFKEVKEKIYKWVGIPVSIGAGATKTLAKFANNYAKKNTKEGIFIFETPYKHKEIMKSISVEDIWGISTRWGRRLKVLGYCNSYQLCHADTATIRAYLGVVVTRIVKELQGISCIELEQVKPKKNIMSSKSFGTLLSNIEPIEEALANYVARACEKLRAQKSKAQGIYVFLHTNKFKHYESQYSNSSTIGFEYPSSDTGFIIKQAKNLLKKIFREGYKYKKTGIILLDIIPEKEMQYNLFFNDISNKDYLMKVIDEINQKFGKKTVFHLAQGITKRWVMKSEYMTFRYTTCWEELLKIK